VDSSDFATRDTRDRSIYQACTVGSTGRNFEPAARVASHSFVQDVGGIVDEWERFAGSIPAAAAMSSEELRTTFTVCLPSLS
jgi:hypothetical protein